MPQLKTLLCGLAAVALAFTCTPTDSAAAGNSIVVTPGVDKVPQRAPAGSTVLLRERSDGTPGIYTMSDDKFTFNTGVTIKAYPGEEATLRGSVRVMSSANGFVLGDVGAEWPQGDGVKVELHYGPIVDANFGDGKNTQSLFWGADGGGVYGSAITNRHPDGDTRKAGICVYTSGSDNPANVTFDGNYVYKCGQLPRSNHEHAFYLNGSRGGTVTDNLIYDAADRGIQNYQDPNGVLERGNLIVSGHNTGMSINNNAANLTMEQNVVAFNARYNFHVGNKQVGGGNLFRNNCTRMSDGRSGISGTRGVTYSNNVTANPQLNANWSTGVVKVMNPTCAAKLPTNSRFRP